MFRSATFKLTSWYMLIIVAICLLFSLVIFSISSFEIESRIDKFQANYRPFTQQNREDLILFRNREITKTRSNLIISLVLSNVSIWIAGGIGSYYLAKRTLKPIEEAHEAQSRFTDDASHELNTPLAIMKTEIEVALKDPTISKKDIKELLASNLEEVNKLTKLSTNLLDLSRLKNNSLKKETLNLYKIAKEVVDKFNKIEDRIILSGNTNVKVASDTTATIQLLTIFMDNALKYSPKDSIININIFGGKEPGFEIVNTGKGISEKDINHIFDRFYQVEASRTNQEKRGYGLGLSLAKRIVEIQGGKLTVSSGINQPTTFRVYFK